MDYRDILKGGLLGITTDTIGAPVDLATMAMRPFGYNVQKPVMGSDWLADKLSSPPRTGAGQAARMVGGLLSPDPLDAVKMAGLLGMTKWDDLLNRQRELEGMRAAMRDPVTGKIYTGFTHQSAINSVPKTEGDVWGRLSYEWDRGTDNTGFINKAGEFISRTDAEKDFNVSTVEDIKDVLRKKWERHGY